VLWHGAGHMVRQVVKKSNRPQLVDAEFEKKLQDKMADVVSGGAKAADTPAAKKSEQELKADRLAGALRENLHKRKEQARARDESSQDTGEEGDGS